MLPTKHETTNTKQNILNRAVILVPFGILVCTVSLTVYMLAMYRMLGKAGRSERIQIVLEAVNRPVLNRVRRCHQRSPPATRPPPAL